MASHGYQQKFQNRGFGGPRGQGPNRPNQGPNRNAPVVKSRLSNALTKISQEVDLDLMESALAISGDAIREIISGRNPGSERTYSAHIEHRIAHTPILSRWFASPDAPFTKELNNQLKFLASTSQRRDGLRRENFKQIAKAFSDDIYVLADALQLAESGVLRIISGELEFDDQRFGHINPLLVAAGFEDGWLELANPSLSDSMIQRLRQMADEEFNDSTEVGVATESHVIAAQNSEIAETSVSENSGVVVAKSEIEANNTASAPNDVLQVKETVMAKTTAKPTPKATSGAPHVAAAASRTALLTRGALSAGRSILSGPAGTPKPIPAAAGIIAAAAASAPKAGPVVTHKVSRVPAAAPVAPVAPAPAATPETTTTAHSAATAAAAGKSLAPAGAKAKATTAPAKKAAKLSKGVAKAGRKAAPAATAPAAPTVAPTIESGRVNQAKSDDSAEKQISLARAAALEELLATSRRGAKVTLWRDLLNSSLPVWGNIRRGQVLLRDSKANEITAHLGLPTGWLDNPVMPPPTLAAWVTDPLVPLPTAANSKQQGLDLAPAADKTTAQTTAASAPRKAAAAPAATQPAEAATTPAAAPATSATVAPTAGTAINWKPATQAKPVETVGPVGTALLSVVGGLMKDGQFTEADALSMLNYFMANKK